MNNRKDGVMRSRSLFVSGFLFLILAVGCGSSSSGSGAGGSLSTGGALGLGGILGHGGTTIASGGAGGGGPSDAGIDIPAVLTDAAVDAPTSSDTIKIAFDAGVTLAQVKELLATRCAGCHTGTGSAGTRIDLTDHPDAATTLYARLLGPVLLEALCGESLDAGGDAAEPHRAIVPGDPNASFLYLKITGTQPSPGNPPNNCGVRMPRVLVPGVDGGAATLPACDSLDGGAAANCLSAAEVDLVRQWIVEGAPQ
jgi:hypothetical protein